YPVKKKKTSPSKMYLKKTSKNPDSGKTGLRKSPVSGNYSSESLAERWENMAVWPAPTRRQSVFQKPPYRFNIC
ncbi:MAG: hypothetical protein OEZ59_06710, partial [Deltaproteobacteria bacterium]|nr:hypothetical protein [Deltaproteobacteria bacterium]